MDKKEAFEALVQHRKGLIRKKKAEEISKPFGAKPPLKRLLFYTELGLSTDPDDDLAAFPVELVRAIATALGIDFPPNYYMKELVPLVREAIEKDRIANP